MKLSKSFLVILVSAVFAFGLSTIVLTTNETKAADKISNVKNGQGLATVYGPAEVCGQFSNFPPGNVTISVSQVALGKLRVDVITQANYYYTFGQGACIPIYVNEVAPFNTNRALPYVYFNTGQVVDLTQNEVSGIGSPSLTIESYAEFSGELDDINDAHLALMWNGTLSCKIEGVECGDDVQTNSAIYSQLISLSAP